MMTTKGNSNELGKKLALILVICMLSAYLPVFTITTAYASTGEVLVTIDLNGGTAINIENGVEEVVSGLLRQLAAPGQLLNAPRLAPSLGYILTGWRLIQPTPTSAWNFSTSRVPSGISELTIQAQWSRIPPLQSIVVGTAEGFPNDIVEVPVSFVGNPGIAGFNLTLGFDSSLVTPIAVTRSDSLGGSVFVSNINQNNDNTISVVWASIYDVRVSELFTISFRINNINMDGRDDIITPIPISVIDALTENRSDIAPPTQNGHVMITSPGAIDLLWGDVNVDGVVDTLDITLLAQHLAGVPGSRPCDMGLRLADVDRNDRVNVGDLILIAQYVADWDGSRGIRLGIPQ